MLLPRRLGGFGSKKLQVFSIESWHFQTLSWPSCNSRARKRDALDQAYGGGQDMGEHLGQQKSHGLIYTLYTQ